MRLLINYAFASFLIYIASCHAMDNNLYVRFTERLGDEAGTVVSFPKSLLADIRFLQNMAEDLPGSGTYDQPFPLLTSNVTPDEFNTIITSIKRFKAPRSEPLQNPIWNLVIQQPNHYAILTNLIRAADFLDIDPIVSNEIKQCIIALPHEKMVPLPAAPGSAGPEDLDRALKTGLKEVNNLNLPSLVPLKEGLIKKISGYYIEKKILDDANATTTMHEKETQKPKLLDYNLMYKANRDSHSFFAQICRPNDCVIAFFSKKYDYKGLAFKPLPYSTMNQVPNQQLIPEKMRALGVDLLNLNTLRCPNATNKNINIFFAKKREPNSAISFEYIEEFTGLMLTIGVSAISYKDTRIAIPDAVHFMDIYTDQNGAEKIVCVLCNGDLNNRIIAIDPNSLEIKILTTFSTPTHEIRAACLVGSTLICSAQESETDYTSLITFDLHTQHTTITKNPKGSLYDDLIAWYFSPNVIQVVGAVKTNDHFIDTHFLDVVKNQHYMEQQQISISYEFTLLFSEALLSKMCIINLDHPDIKDLQWIDTLDEKDGIYVSGFDPNTKNVILVKWLDKTKLLKTITSLKNLTHLSIEQLYALGGICYRIASNTFETMTPTEKKLFEAMPVEDQNIFHRLFSVGGMPINEPFETQSIINPVKMFPQEQNLQKPTPLPGYAMSGQQRGTKRTAEEPRKARHTKRRKLEQEQSAASGSESSSEETLNESEEEKE